ncbi:hypothetical protein ILUMI_24891 [Ignelater luminosus]|uniref:Uncharacterized protein n=1 Tax=Ignelater luminosus TaxID=2038154 RepID=A0A8K0C9N0_IGNLU|nr:hypothetical protein ILUMI_24891 [Ignelater luminosus]
MAKLNVKENLKNVIGLMMVLGIWPRESPSTLYIIRGSTLIFLVVLFTATIIAQALKFVDVESTSFGLCVVMAALHCIVKSVVLYTKRKHIFNLMRMLDEPTLSVHDDHLFIYLTDKLKMCTLWRYVYFYCTVTTGVLINTLKMLNMKSPRSLPVPFPIDMEKQPFLVFVSVWLFEAITMILGCASIACFDALLFSFIAIAAAELRILREKIMEATDFQKFDSRTMQILDFDDIVNNRLKNCIKQHVAIER